MAKAKAAVPKPLTGLQLAEMLKLLKGADSIELKLTVPTDEQRSAIVALGMDPLAAQVRQIVFFDTPELTLYNAGVVARARRVQGKGDDSVIKLRPVVVSELPPELRESPECVVEVDAVPGGHVCSASLKGTPRTSVRDVAQGDAPLRKLFSKEQRAFFAERAPAGIDLDSLSILGPTFILKSTFTPAELGRRFVAEMWLYPDGSRVLELSTRCETNEAFQVAAEARAFLSKSGVDLSGEQQTKTRKALEYFAETFQNAGA